MEKLADFILSNRRAISVIAFLLIIASLYPAFNIRADFSLEGFFPENDPTIDLYRTFSEEFGRDDNVIIIGIKSEHLISNSVLSDIQTLRDSLKTIPFVIDVRSIWDARRFISENGFLSSEEYITINFLNQAGSDDLNELSRNLIRNPFINGLFINKTADFTALFIEIDEDENIFPSREIIIENLYRILEPFQQIYEIHIAGIPYFRNQYIHLLNGEIIFYISISSVLIILLLWFLFRHIQGVIIPILIVWITILFTLSVLQLSGGYFEVLTSSIAPILLCVGVADSVHMLAKYNDGRFAGLTRRKSLRESLIILGSATFLTSVTTAIGFATLLTSNVIPMRTFGVYTAIGVMLAYLITIFLLPSMMPWFRDGNRMESTQGRVHNAIGSVLLRTFNIARKYHKAVVIVTLVVTAITAYGITQLRVNGFVFDDVGRDSELLKSSNIISENLSPQFPLEIVIDTGEENGIADPDLLNRISRLEAFLMAYSEVDKITSVNTLFSEIHRVLAPEEFNEHPLPQTRELASQYLLLIELTDDQILERFADFNYQQARISTQTHDVGSYRINQIRSELEDFLSVTFPDEIVTMTGTTILVADLTDNIVFSLASSIGLAFLFISLIMAWLFRNFRLVLISLIPNLMPIIFVAGVMGYWGIDIKPSTAVIFTIAFGIAVDDSIHFLARFRIETRRGKELVEAIRYTTEKTGRAIVLTSAILIMGFGTLGFSDFESTMLMGRLVCLTIFVALIADLFFLPALIYWIKPDLHSVRKQKSALMSGS